LPGRPDAPLAAERGAVAFPDLAADDGEIELALVDQRGNLGAEAKLDLGLDGGIAGGELAEQRGERMQVEIFRHADPDQSARVAAQASLGLLVEGDDAARVGEQHLALLGETQAPHVAHNQARADLLLEPLDVQTHG
jgi:hypothetical protein